MLYIEAAASLTHERERDSSSRYGESGHQGWVTVGDFPALASVRVGNSKSSNLASQAAITLEAPQIWSEKYPARPGFASMSVESVRHDNAYSAVTMLSKWSLKYCKALYPTAIASPSSKDDRTHVLQHKETNLLQRNIHILHN